MPLKEETPVDKLQADTKKVLADMGGFLKKGWGFVAKNASETATKVADSKFGQGVKTGYDKASEVTKASVKAGVEKIKPIGEKVKDGVKTGFVAYK